MQIKIFNPVPGAAGYCSGKRARFLIRKHRARMRDDGLLEFINPWESVILAQDNHQDDITRQYAGIHVVDRWTFPHTVWTPVPGSERNMQT